MKSYTDLTETQKKIYDSFSRDWINNMVKLRDVAIATGVFLNFIKMQLKKGKR